MKYKISIDDTDLILIGEALDAMPHGRVAGLVAKVQTQINEQELAEIERVCAEKSAAEECLRLKIISEIPAEKPINPKRRRS